MSRLNAYTDAEKAIVADAVQNSDTSTAPMQFVLGENNMISNSPIKLATQQSIKTYVDTKVESVLVYQGMYDAATNTPDLETPLPGVIKLGYMYVVSVAGTFFTTEVAVGDALIANKDDPSVETDWDILNRNLDAATIKTLYESNPDTNAFTDAEQTNVANNTLKETNANHTGEVTGSGVLTVDSTAISNKALITGAAGQEVLVNDAGTLKKVNANDFLGGGASGFTLHFDANDAIYNINHRATASSRNGHPIIKFSDADDDGVTFGDTIPNSYNTETITVDIDWVAETATSGAVSWFVSFERNSPNGNDIDSDSYASARIGTSTTNATNGVVTRTSITFTQAQADGVVGNDHFRLKLVRDPSDVGDTMSGDAELLKISVRV